MSEKKEKLTCCDECHQAISDQIILIIARTEDLHSKILNRYCSKCGLKLVEEYKKERHWIIEQ